MAVHGTAQAAVECMTMAKFNAAAAPAICACYLSWDRQLSQPEHQAPHLTPEEDEHGALMP